MQADPGADFDVIIVGGGPAGIAAGTHAAEHGARTVIIDSGIRPGGQIWRHSDRRSLPTPARAWLERSERAGVSWLLQSTVVDGSLQNGLVVVSRVAGTRTLRARRIVIATGARELFLPFPGWTLPNVVGVGGAQALLKGGLEMRGKRAIVAGSGPLLLPVSAALVRAGARVRHVVEQATWGRLARFASSLLHQPDKLLLAARYRAAIPFSAYRAGTWVERADGTSVVQSVTLTDGDRRWSEPCDLLCCSFGLVPMTELARLLGCSISDGKVAVDDRQTTSVAGVYSAGESTGVAGDSASIAEGEIAGICAATSDTAVLPRDLVRARDLGRAFQDDLREGFLPRREVLSLADADTIVCRCEDVRFGSLDPGWTGRQAKLYTRMGMGACQGAVCGPIGQRLFGWETGSVRPPLFAPLVSEWLLDDTQPGVESTGSLSV